MRSQRPGVGIVDELGVVIRSFLSPSSSMLGEDQYLLKEHRSTFYGAWVVLPFVVSPEVLGGRGWWSSSFIAGGGKSQAAH
jgi:hypothetical protein